MVKTVELRGKDRLHTDILNPTKINTVVSISKVIDRMVILLGLTPQLCFNMQCLNAGRGVNAVITLSTWVDIITRYRPIVNVLEV